MSDFASARDAITADLNHAREGIAFYTKRIAVLQNILHEFEQLDGEPATPSKANKLKGRRGRKPKAAAAPATKRARKQVSTGDTLPSTNAQFWTGLLGADPVSNTDLLNSAFAALKITPTPGQVSKMKQRVANAIVNLGKAGTLQSTGTGRGRRFSLKA